MKFLMGFIIFAVIVIAVVMIALFKLFGKKQGEKYYAYDRFVYYNGYNFSDHICNVDNFCC